jgi:hypothetical protein
MRQRTLRVAGTLTTLDYPAEGPEADGQKVVTETNQDVVV